MNTLYRGVRKSFSPQFLRMLPYITSRTNYKRVLDDYTSEGSQVEFVRHKLACFQGCSWGPAPGALHEYQLRFPISTAALFPEDKLP